MSWFNGVTFASNDSDSYRQQIAIGLDNSHIYFRNRDTNGWRSWITVLDSDNCTSYKSADSDKLGGLSADCFMTFQYQNEYINASFRNLDYSAKAHQKYIEFWDGGGRDDTGWYKFRLGELRAVDGGLYVGDNPVIHSGNIGSQSVNYANSAGSSTYLNASTQTDLNLCVGDNICKYYRFQSGASNQFSVLNNANGLLWLGTHAGTYGAQIGISSNGRLYHRHVSANSFGGWSTVAFTTDLPTKASWNYDDVYLKLSGGTLKSTNFYPLTLNGGADGSGLMFSQEGTEKIGIALFKPGDWGMAILHYSSSKAIGIKDDGTPYYGWGESKYTLLHTGNSAVSKSGETLTVNMAGTTYSLTNTWRGITDSYSGSDTSTSLSQKGANNMYNALLNGYANNSGQVGGCSIITDDSFLYKNTYSVTLPISQITEDYWYVTINMVRGWNPNVSKCRLTANYSNTCGIVYLDLVRYAAGNEYFRAFTSDYVGCNIVGITMSGAPTNTIYIKLRKPVEYGGTVPDGSFTINCQHTCTLTASATIPTTSLNFIEIKPGKYYDPNLFTEFRNSGNNISTTIAGITKVLTVSYASSAGSVAWGNISGKPSTFTPATHNHDSTYLKLSGGELSGGISINSSAWATIKYTRTDCGNGSVGGLDGSGLYFQHTTEGGQQSYMYLKGDSGLKINGNTVIHSGNIGSQSVNYATSAGSATSASYLPPKYDGGDKPNPQSYFNENIGAKVAMTRHATIGGTTAWFDTLWINGYAGGDVPNMVALTTIRNGTPRAFLSAQSNRSTTYGTYYELISSYNIASQSVNYATSSGTANSPRGFSFSDRSSNDWTGVPGTFITDWSHSSGADIMFKNDGAKLNVITDGRFYQGIDVYGSSKRVLDEYDITHTTWGDADTLDGYHYNTLYTSVEDWISKVGNTHTITVSGDSDTYCPVVIDATYDKTSRNFISIWKNLGSPTASYPGNHSNGTASMWLIIEGRSCVWDGNGGYYRTIYKSQPYATLVSEATTVYSAVSVLCVYLRGGGTEYKISTTYPASVNIYYSETNLGSTTYPAIVSPRTNVANGGIINGTFYGNCTGNAATATSASSVPSLTNSEIDTIIV